VPEAIIPDGSVVITPVKQYEELQALTKAVDKLTATVDPALADIRKDVHELGVRLDEHRKDIDANTKWRFMLIGALTLLSALVGYGLLTLAPLGG
jgi:hypothetical protein